MANYIDTAFVKIFHDNVQLALQQKGSRLKPFVTVDDLHGEEGYYDFLLKDDDVTVVADDFTDVNTMHPDTVITEPQWMRRKVTGKYLTKAYLIEKKDKIRLLADPTNAYVQAIAYAMGRKIDKLIIDAVTATAYTGKNGTVAVDLPSSQIIEHNDTGLTLEKILQAKIILDEADAFDEERYFVVTPRQLANLLSNTDVKATDYLSIKALVQGDTDTFMGFKFITSNLLNTEEVTLSDSSTATADVCLVFTKPGVLLAIGKEADASIDKRPDKNNAIQIFFGMYAGATRMDENRVVKVPCVQS